ncbi:hypothetical protein M9458_012060, partial [Cirrhinus mrigala]
GVGPLDGLLSGGLVVRFSRDNDGVLVYQLARGIGKSRERKSDSMHLTLVNPLLMLFLEVTTP